MATNSIDITSLKLNNIFNLTNDEKERLEQDLQCDDLKLQILKKELNKGMTNE